MSLRAAHPPSHVHVIHLVAYEGPESGRTAGRRTLPRCLMDMLAEVDIIGHNVRGDCMRLVHDFNVDFDADVQMTCDTMQYARKLLGPHSPWNPLDMHMCMHMHMDMHM